MTKIWVLLVCFTTFYCMFACRSLESQGRVRPYIFFPQLIWNELIVIYWWTLLDLIKDGLASLLNLLPPLAWSCLELACPEGSFTLLLLQLHILSWYKFVPLCLLPSDVLRLWNILFWFFFFDPRRKVEWFKVDCVLSELQVYYWS